MSDSTHATEHGHHEDLGFLQKYIFSQDHKIIGIQFMFTGLLMLMLGGGLAMLFRIQLGWPNSEIPILGRWLWDGAAGAKCRTIFTTCSSPCTPR